MHDVHDEVDGGVLSWCMTVSPVSTDLARASLEANNVGLVQCNILKNSNSDSKREDSHCETQEYVNSKHPLRRPV